WHSSHLPDHRSPAMRLAPWRASSPWTPPAQPTTASLSKCLLAWAACKQGFSGTSGISSTTGSDATDAKLAMGVYEPEFTGADGYELVERFADGKNGLNAALFANGNDRVLVFAGTDPGSWANWKANFAQAFGFKSAQYEMGIKLATDLQAAYGNIRFTGHSLGGGIA